MVNIASEKTNAVISDFHQHDTADEDHEPGNEQEAREIKPQPLRKKAKQERRHEHLHDAPQLIARDEGAVFLALRERGDRKP